MRAWNLLRTISALTHVLAGCFLLSGAWTPSVAAEKPARLEKREGDITVRVQTRSANQIAAFYEARGFPQSALNILARHCFLTVTIRNQSKEFVWLAPASWSFESADRNTASSSPVSASYWNKQWHRIGLSAAYQATFRWTQLPESRDLRPSEPVGGNIALRGKPGKFALNVDFATGEKREGPHIYMRFEHLSCLDG